MDLEFYMGAVEPMKEYMMDGSVDVWICIEKYKRMMLAILQY